MSHEGLMHFLQFGIGISVVFFIHFKRLSKGDERKVKIRQKPGQNYFHHLPRHQEPVNLDGMTLSKALSALASMDFGARGGMFTVNLSDGTLLRAQPRKATRWGYTRSGKRILRKYRI